MPPATYRGNPSTGNLRTLQRGGLPPSLAPLVRNPFTQPRHYHPFIFYIVGRGLDPSATFRPTPANGSPVGEKFIPPAHLPPPLTSAGRRGRRPLQRQTAGFLAAANVRGGLGAGRPTSHCCLPTTPNKKPGRTFRSPRRSYFFGVIAS